MNNDFVTQTLQQVKDLGKDLGERVRESAVVTGHQTEDLAGKVRDEAVKRAPQVRDLLGKAYKVATDVMAKIDGKPSA